MLDDIGVGHAAINTVIAAMRKAGLSTKVRPRSVLLGHVPNAP
jgi:hypothetical protein